jgi:hypothetical protein
MILGRSIEVVGGPGFIDLMFNIQYNDSRSPNRLGGWNSYASISNTAVFLFSSAVKPVDLCFFFECCDSSRTSAVVPSGISILYRGPDFESALSCSALRYKRHIFKEIVPKSGSTYCVSLHLSLLDCPIPLVQLLVSSSH